MGIWRNVTDTFSEERRHYSNTYLEICEVYDEAVEVSIFSADNNQYEIYVSYGIMYGIIYCSQEEAYEKFEEIKRVLEKDYVRTVQTGMVHQKIYHWANTNHIFLQIHL